MRLVALLSILVFATPLVCQRGTVTPYAPGCGGATLSGSFRPVPGGGAEMLVLEANGLHPHAFGAMAWGWQQIQTPILNTNCFLHLDAVWSITFVTDQNGYHRFARSWPRSIGGFFRIQMGSLQVSPIDIRVTDAVIAHSNN